MFTHSIKFIRIFFKKLLFAIVLSVAKHIHAENVKNNFFFRVNKYDETVLFLILVDFSFVFFLRGNFILIFLSVFI